MSACIFYRLVGQKSTIVNTVKIILVIPPSIGYALFSRMYYFFVLIWRELYRRLYTSAVGPGFFLVQDNAQPHVARVQAVPG